MNPEVFSKVSSIGEDWPHDQDPPPFPPGFVPGIAEDLMNFAELLELPVPRASFLEPALYCFLIVWSLGLFRETYRLLRGRQPWHGWFLHFVNPHTYDDILPIAFAATSVAISLFMMIACMFGSTGFLAALSAPLVWTLWTCIVAYYSRPPATIEGVDEKRRYLLNKGVLVHPLLTLAAVCLLPLPQQRIANGIVHLHVWLAENFILSSPGWLKDMAQEIVTRPTYPQYITMPLEVALESFVSRI
ncbi:hypothetical protein F4677DRAFT_448756 [Hypoxylon crocopeplum]|nr:hypothetical protein F4677DRAFT_448756 [Hypoxylon crocopeplum]